MPRAFILVIVLASLLAGPVGGSGSGTKKRREADSELAHVPAAAQSWRNPYEQRPDAVQAGKLLFDRHCAQCHGADGRGRGKAPDLHASPVQKAAPGTLFWFLRNGNLKEGMPSWSSLPDQQVWQLVSFLRTLH